jgi:hypothetical protein
MLAEMSLSEPTATEQIDAIISNLPDWRGRKLAELRKIINRAHPELTEAVKWKKPSKPEGVAVWECNGNVCIGEALKNAVRLTFPKGALVHDIHKLFNARLDSKTVRGIDFSKDMPVDEVALSELIVKAARLNIAS